MARSLMSSRTAFALAAMLLAIAAALPAAAQDYPRLALYGRMYGGGYPMWDSTGTLDQACLDDISRYHELIFDASPITPYRPDAVAAIRQRHPGIVMLAYLTGHYIWPAADPDSFVHYPTRHWRLVRDLDGFLYNKNGQQYGLTNYSFANVNLAKKDATGQFVVAVGLANLFYDAIIRPNIWDGLFIDTWCHDILWTQSPGESIDFVRAGYANATDFQQAWAAASDTMASRLRGLCGPNVILCGNCIPGTRTQWFNGWMAENFPFQNGGSWYTNMFRDPGGYITDERVYRAPRRNHLFTAADPPDLPYNAINVRKVRLGLGSASMGEGYGMFGYGARATLQYPYHRWWYDEYSVDRTTGYATTDLAHTGWLGQPKGPYYQMIWIGDNPDSIRNGDFETDLSGWNFQNFIPATFNRDVSTAGTGSASLHVSISTGPNVDWQVYAMNNAQLPVTTNQMISATFRAKASSPRVIIVAAAGQQGTCPITTEWKQYQVNLISGVAGTTACNFWLGHDAGEVWLDDIHFQVGASTVYRRDFDHGTILVNPSTSTLDVHMERSFQRIHGIHDTAVNDGSAGDRQTIAPSDALFLIGDDRTPPATMLDLRIRR